MVDRKIEVIRWRDEVKMANCITIVIPDEMIEELERGQLDRLHQLLTSLQDLFNEEES